LLGAAKRKAVLGKNFEEHRGYAREGSKPLDKRGNSGRSTVHTCTSRPLKRGGKRRKRIQNKQKKKTLLMAEETKGNWTITMVRF